MHSCTLTPICVKITLLLCLLSLQPVLKIKGQERGE
jgi:hypothetical protein